MTERQILPIPGVPSYPRETHRTHVTAFEPDGLEVEGHSNFTRVDTLDERYAQVVAALFVFASLMMLVASIYGSQHSAFRGAFVWLALAALAALLHSALILVVNLAETGDLIVSFDWLSWLRVPREIFKIACVLLSIIGFIALALRLRTGRSRMVA